MPESLPIIKIKPESNKHAIFLILIGLLIALVNAGINQFFDTSKQLVSLFIYLVALVFIITGIAKKTEPKHSFLITPEFLHYQHRYGQWRLNWQQIERIALIKETIGIEQLTLPYLGIRLSSIDTLASSIRPRLANRLIHEQKPLIAFAIKQELIPFNHGIISFEPYKLDSGNLAHGPVAAFLHQCKALESAYKLHLFLPDSCMDRQIEDFCLLLKQCQASSKQPHHKQP